MELLGVGAAEAFVILVITLIVVGPQRFPEIARQGGRYYRLARRYAAEVTADVRGAMEELESEVEHQQEEFREAHHEIASSISASINETRAGLEEIGRETESLLSESAPSSPKDKPPSTNGSGGLIAPRELSGSEVDDDGGAGRRTEGD